MKTDNQHESEVSRNERLHELYGEDARERAVALCFRLDEFKDPCLSTLLEWFWGAPFEAFTNYRAFRVAASERNHEVLGMLFVDALDKLAKEWLETVDGQELVSTIVHQLAEDEA